MKHVLILAIVLATTQPAHAWNGHCHRVIASIAFQRLEPERCLELADRIRNHPRFDADFAEKMPDEVRAGDDQMQAEWLFQQAACWPDRVRSLKGKVPKRNVVSQKAKYRVVAHFYSHFGSATFARRRSLVSRLILSLGIGQ